MAKIWRVLIYLNCARSSKRVVFANSLLCLAAFLVIIANIASGASAPFPPAAQDKPDTTTRYLAWQLGSKLSLAALGYSQGASTDVVNRMVDQVRPVAKYFNAEIPPFPVKTGENVKDSASILHYLLNTADSIATQIGSGHPTDHVYLFEVALKSNILLLMYAPKDDSGKTIANVIRSRAPQAGIPYDVWKKVVDKVEAGAPFDEVKAAVIQMHEEVANIYSRGK